jgi:hypothetical protein
MLASWKIPRSGEISRGFVFKSPLGHEPFGHDAMPPVLRLTGPRRADRLIHGWSVSLPCSHVTRWDRAEMSSFRVLCVSCRALARSVTG